MKKDTPRLLSALLVLTLLAGCDVSPKSGKGFVFPEGDIARGRKAFVEMKCYECHRVDGVADLPVPTAEPGKVVQLGGKVAQLRTYGDLVTAVIHPSYERTVQLPGPAGKEITMPRFNDTMTVGQMLDIVTFLHPRYEKLEPLYDHVYWR